MSRAAGPGGHSPFFLCVLGGLCVKFFFFSHAKLAKPAKQNPSGKALPGVFVFLRVFRVFRGSLS
jgi:hypothetical protein